MSSSTTFVINTRSLAEGSIRGIRIALFTTGIVCLLIGAIILFQPGAALIAVGWMFGIYFIIAGLLRLSTIALATNSSTGYRIMTGILGLLLIAGGIYTLGNPVFGAEALAAVIGITWLIEGIAALTEPSNDRALWFGVLYGVVCIVAGVLVLFTLQASATVLLMVVAAMMVAGGIIQIVQGFLFGRHRAH